MKDKEISLFLHEQGYDFFTIPRLTHVEINALIWANNKKVRDQNKQAKRARKR